MSCNYSAIKYESVGVTYYRISLFLINSKSVTWWAHVRHVPSTRLHARRRTSAEHWTRHVL